jgi:hypothetical protein
VNTIEGSGSVGLSADIEPLLLLHAAHKDTNANKLASLFTSDLSIIRQHRREQCDAERISLRAPAEHSQGNGLRLHAHREILLMTCAMQRMCHVEKH